jgi:hypothetical protein
MSNQRREKTMAQKTRIKVLAALLAALVAMLLWAASASALNYALNFRNYDPNQLQTTQRSGASVFRTELDFTCTAGGSNWGQFDPIVEAAWKRGIRILPVLVRSARADSQPACENAEHKRFLNSGDGSWSAWWGWSKAAVERYGINGDFWNGKANPTPITAWEVGNEPNLAQNNPGGQYVQPQAYGEFLSYTNNALQAGSVNKTAHGTEVISGGLYMPAGNYSQFLEQMGHTNAYTAVGIHPYSWGNGATGVANQINMVRSTLNNNISGGSGKALWITELGWNAGGTGGLSSPSDSAQRDLLNESFDWIQANASAKNIALLTWYKIQDQSASGPNWDEHTGLRRFDGTYRPAWYAFQEQVGAPKWPITARDELGFVRFNHTPNTELVSYGNGPQYQSLLAISNTSYPTISDPQYVQAVPIDSNGDSIDALGFVRLNQASGHAHYDIYGGPPNYQTLVQSLDTGYPAISDPQNVQAFAIDSNGDGKDSLAFVRLNAAEKADIAIYDGPNFQTLSFFGKTGYPSISDPQNVRVVALDLTGDGPQALAFVRLNSLGNASIFIYGGPTYQTLLYSGNTAYPSVTDPQNIEVMAMDTNGDGKEELGFLRFNQSSGNAHLDLYGGSDLRTLLASNNTAYPAISDPQNVQAVPLNEG